MIRKRSRKFRLITSIALVMLMAFSTAIPAFAGGPPKHSVGTGPLDQAKSVITKRLKMPMGTTTPEASFKFIFSKVGIDAAVDPATIAKMPEIGPKYINFSPADDTNHANNGNGSGLGIFFNMGPKGEPDGEEKWVVKESSDLALDPKIVWPGTGVYKYTVREAQVNPDGYNSINLNNFTSNTGYETSPARYTVEFWIAKDEHGELYVQYVNAITIAGYIDEYYDGDPGGTKVDPTPGGKRPKPYEKLEDGFSQLIFTNKFWMSDGKETDIVLELWKNTAGYDPDPNWINTVAFEFKINFIKPSLVPGTPVYRGYVVDAAGNIVKGTLNHSGTDPITGYINFPAGSNVNVKLWNDQKLKFIDVHVGAIVQIEELLPTTDFIPEYVRTFAGTDTFTGLASYATWGFPRNEPQPDIGPHRLPMGVDKNYVKYLNTRTNATPTGLDVDDLPYVTLIALGLAGFLGFAIIKGRRRVQYDV
ncbi:MAG: hypothetical protein FWG88_06465 [Oscillospiraceae bacterium]|nr:hypothetical protein [Oscillospiraceae bacterium]